MTLTIDLHPNRLMNSKKVYKQGFRKAWIKDPLFKSWLKDRPHKAYCTICKKEMTAVVTALRKHQSTSYHQTQARLLQVPSSGRIDSMFWERCQGNDVVKETELRLTAFISERNLSFQ